MDYHRVWVTAELTVMIGKITTSPLQVIYPVLVGEKDRNWGSLKMFVDFCGKRCQEME
jgi:hypothetical protein